MKKAKVQDENYFLWKRFKEGDSRAFFLLYDQFFDLLFNYGIHFTGDYELIKDCIHDLFLDLYKYRKRLSETDNIQFYLFRSLRRLIHKGKIKNILYLPDEQLFRQNEMSVAAIDESIIAAETREENNMALAEVLKELSDRQCEGLSLKFEHNFSYKEIANILGISVESARTCIYRALKDLRKAVKSKNSSIQFFFLLVRDRFYSKNEI